MPMEPPLGEMIAYTFLELNKLQLPAGGEVRLHPLPRVGPERLAAQLFEQVEDHSLERFVRGEFAVQVDVGVTQEQTERVGDPASAG